MGQPRGKASAVDTVWRELIRANSERQPHLANKPPERPRRLGDESGPTLDRNAEATARDEVRSFVRDPWSQTTRPAKPMPLFDLFIRVRACATGSDDLSERVAAFLEPVTEHRQSSGLSPGLSFDQHFGFGREVGHAVDGSIDGRIEFADGGVQSSA